ncbi:p-loop NTPase [Dikerogammarus haemobaphes nudivirus]|nr:p-loop NTPase [Dikerogammarus haemobaphes nudivirus]
MSTQSSSVVVATREENNRQEAAIREVIKVFKGKTKLKKTEIATFNNNNSYKRNRFMVEVDSDGTDEIFKCMKKPCNNSIDGNPLHYWQSLGLIKSQCAQPKLKNALTVENVYADIKHQNNLFFKHFDDNPVEIPIWSIDGTCATGKSRTMEQIFKTNRHIKLFGLNTHPYSSMGYYYTSCKLLKKEIEKGNKIVSDRTPYNNLYPWFSIWQMISFIKNKNLPRKVNSYIEHLTPHELSFIPNLYNDYILNKFESFMNIGNDTVLSKLSSTTKTILYVNSDEKITRQRLRERNEDSDYERSFWDFYITLQNYAYAYMALKYPQNYIIIDLNRYYNNLDIVQKSVHKILKFEIPKKNDSMSFEPLEFTKPISLTVLEFQKSERIRPIIMEQFYNQIKHITV